jgi:uncharacterized protein
VNDLFAPPGNEWRPVSPELGKLRRLLLVVLVGLALLAVAVLGGFVWPSVWWLLPAVALLGGLGFGWVVIDRNARSWGYAERDEDLYVKHGAMFRELVAVPYGRMQYVDVTSGPLEQLFGISTVHLHTASPKTSARIPGLPKDEAARLRDRLTSLGEAQAAGL